MMTQSQLTTEQFKPIIQQALRAWGNVEASHSDHLGALLIAKNDRSTNGAESPPGPRLTTNTILFDGISVLQEDAPLAAEVLRARFVNGEKIYAVANKLNVSENTISRIQKRGIGKLAEIILTWELQDVIFL